MPQSVVNYLNFYDIEEFCNDVRRCDIDEIKASCGLTPKEVLEAAFYYQGNKMALRINNEIVCVFGVTDLLDSRGIPWMIATNKVYKYKFSFLRACRKIIPVLFSEYHYLENYIDARNEESIEWLQWLGFEILEAKPFGGAGLLFHKFRMFKDV